MRQIEKETALKSKNSQALRKLNQDIQKTEIVRKSKNKSDITALNDPKYQRHRISTDVNENQKTLEYEDLRKSTVIQESQTKNKDRPSVRKSTERDSHGQRVHSIVVIEEKPNDK